MLLSFCSEYLVPFNAIIFSLALLATAASILVVRNLWGLLSSLSAIVSIITAVIYLSMSSDCLGLRVLATTSGVSVASGAFALSIPKRLECCKGDVNQESDNSSQTTGHQHDMFDTDTFVTFGDQVPLLRVRSIPVCRGQAAGSRREASHHWPCSEVSLEVLETMTNFGELMLNPKP